MKSKGCNRKYLCCDNAGGNVKGLKKVAQKYGVEMEFTAPHTLKFNGVVERKFPVLMGKAKAMMHTANLTKNAKKNVVDRSSEYSK